MSCVSRRAPVVNRTVDDRWKVHCQEIHVRKVENVRPEIDATIPHSKILQSSKRGKSKKDQLHAQRTLQVHRENQMLLKKILMVESRGTGPIRRKKSRKGVKRPRRKSSSTVSVNQAEDESTKHATRKEYEAQEKVCYQICKPRAIPQRPHSSPRQGRMIQVIRRENTALLQRILSAKPTITKGHLKRWKGEQRRLVRSLRSNSANRTCPTLPQPFVNRKRPGGLAAHRKVSERQHVHHGNVSAQDDQTCSLNQEVQGKNGDPDIAHHFADEFKVEPGESRPFLDCTNEFDKATSGDLVQNHPKREQAVPVEPQNDQAVPVEPQNDQAVPVEEIKNGETVSEEPENDQAVPLEQKSDGGTTCTSTNVKVVRNTASKSKRRNVKSSACIKKSTDKTNGSKSVPHGYNTLNHKTKTRVSKKVPVRPSSNRNKKTPGRQNRFTDQKTYTQTNAPSSSKPSKPSNLANQKEGSRSMMLKKQSNKTEQQKQFHNATKLSKSTNISAVHSTASHSELESNNVDKSKANDHSDKSKESCTPTTERHPAQDLKIIEVAVDSRMLSNDNIQEKDNMANLDKTDSKREEKSGTTSLNFTTHDEDTTKSSSSPSKTNELSDIKTVLEGALSDTAGSSTLNKLLSGASLSQDSDAESFRTPESPLSQHDNFEQLMIKSQSSELSLPFTNSDDSGDEAEQKLTSTMKGNLESKETDSESRVSNIATDSTRDEPRVYTRKGSSRTRTSSIILPEDEKIPSPPSRSLSLVQAVNKWRRENRLKKLEASKKADPGSIGEHGKPEKTSSVQVKGTTGGSDTVNSRNSAIEGNASTDTATGSKLSDANSRESRRQAEELSQQCVPYCVQSKKWQGPRQNYLFTTRNYVTGYFYDTQVGGSIKLDCYPTSSWSGPRPGYVFKTGKHGTGYYVETRV